MTGGALDPRDLLILATIRLLGGQHLDPKHASLKPHSVGIGDLEQRGFLERKGATELVPGKPGKSGKPGKAKEKTTTVLALTPTGRAALEGDPVSAAIAASGFLSDLKRQMADDRATVLSAVAANEARHKTAEGKGNASLAKDLEALAAKVDALAKKVAELDQATSGGSSVGDVKEAFARYERRIDALSEWLKTSTAGTAVNPRLPRPSSLTASAEADSKGGSAPPIRDVIRVAYQELCFFREFEDGVVELPRLYHKVQQSLPAASVADFHAELKRLVSDRKAELKILNEVHLAKEPQLGIRDGALYYYVYWREAFESR